MSSPLVPRKHHSLAGHVDAKGGAISSPVRSVRKDIGMMMILLAAETAVIGTQLCDSGSIPDLAMRSLCDEAYSNAGNTDSNSGSPSTPTTPEEELLAFVEEATSTPGSKRKYKYHGSSGPSPLAMNLAIVGLVLSFVPAQDRLKNRRVSQLWKTVTHQTVQLRRMGHTNIMAAFFPAPVFQHQGIDAENDLHFSHPATWKCQACGMSNGEGRILCANNRCQMPARTHAEATRIFLGQLRRDATVPFIQWLLTNVMEEPKSLMCVENHRHTVTRRGKGCAWAYFCDAQVAQRVLAHHHRVYYDVIRGEEGAWLVRPQDIHMLAEESAVRSGANFRPRHMPRSALVAELPAVNHRYHALPADGYEEPAAPQMKASLPPCYEATAASYHHTHTAPHTAHDSWAPAYVAPPVYQPFKYTHQPYAPVLPEGWNQYVSQAATPFYY